MDFDVVIAGGGMVGASLACALRDTPLRVALVEAVAPETEAQPSYDDRAIALSLGSKQTLERFGVWAAIAPAATAIDHVHVSDRGHFGATRLRAADEGVEALGYVTEARAIGGGLAAALEGAANLERVCPARVEDVQADRNGARAVIADADGSTHEVRTRLVVAADGADSALRRKAGVFGYGRDYHQAAVIANVAGDRPHGGAAFERFTASGPLALLPFTGGEAGDRRWGAVWTVDESEREAVLAMDDAAFLAALQERFGHRAGTFRSVGPRSAYPLQLQVVPRFVTRRQVFIGNAAHVVHPVAGQGFNLGLRDVAALARLAHEAAGRGDDVGAAPLLRRYIRRRRPDYAAVAGLTDGFVRAFTSRLPPVVAARNLGLMGLELFPPAKHALARRLMGLWN